MRALAGIVSSHAIMILLATPHFTVLAPWSFYTHD